MIFYLFLFRIPYKHLKTEKEHKNIEAKRQSEFPEISIIITAKNKEKVLKENLPFILKQDYPNFQVVVVNNGSTDNTQAVLNEFSNTYSNLYITYIPVDAEKINDKKLALTIGVKAAKYDILLFTEADCKPSSDKWVNEYAKKFYLGKEVVIGICQFKIKKGFFRKFILFDNLLFTIGYSSFALLNKPYTGIGRNMAYRKNLFFDNKGFSSLLNIEHGEDSLFLNKIARKNNTSLILSPESMVISDVVNCLSTWRSIKTKHLITKKHLAGYKTNLLSIEVFSRYGFHLLFLILFILAILNNSIILIIIASILYFIRYFVQMNIINKTSKLFNAGKFYFSLPLLDLGVPIMNYLFLKHEKKNNRMS